MGPHSRGMRCPRFASVSALFSKTAVVDQDMVATIENVLKCYVRKNGSPIESCTIVLRARHQQAWNIPREHWNYANSAAKILALACLAEQRFLEGHFSPHLNATMFHLIGQGITVGSDQIAPFYPRRGGGLQIGGLRFKDIVFQRPPQIEGTECRTINNRLLAALNQARRLKAPCVSAIDSSLDAFLLANSETPELDLDSCVMLSAIAFERLLEPLKSGAQETALAFADYWIPFSKVRIANAKRVKPDQKFYPARLAIASKMDEGTVRSPQHNSAQRASHRIQPQLVGLATPGDRRLRFCSDFKASASRMRILYTK